MFVNGFHSFQDMIVRALGMGAEDDFSDEDFAEINDQGYRSVEDHIIALGKLDGEAFTCYINENLVVYPAFSSPEELLDNLQRFMTDEKIDPNQAVHIFLKPFTDSCLRGVATQIQQAIIVNRPDMVEVLLARGARVTIRDLITAIETKNSQTILPMLMKKVANPNEADVMGYTALHHAVRHCDIKAINILLEFGADPNHPGRINICGNDGAPPTSTLNEEIQQIFKGFNPGKATSYSLCLAFRNFA